MEERGTQGFREGPAKRGAPQAPSAPGPTPLKRDLSAQRFLGRESAGLRGPSPRLALTVASGRKGFAAAPRCPRPAAGPGTHVRREAGAGGGGGDSESRRPRRQHHTPRAPVLAHRTHARREPDVLPPPPASRVDAGRIRHPPLAKDPQTANHRARGALGGKLSLEGLGGWGQEGSPGERQGEGTAREGFSGSRPHPWHPMKTNRKEASRRWEDTSGFLWRRLLMASVLLRAPQA